MAELLEEITTQMDEIPRRCQALDQAVQPARLSPAELIIAQQRYNELDELQAVFIRSVGRFNMGLPTDKEGDPIFPINSKAGYRW